MLPSSQSYPSHSEGSSASTINVYRTDIRSVKWDARTLKDFDHPLRALEQQTVPRIRHDDEPRVRDRVGDRARMLGRKDAIVLAADHDHRRGDVAELGREVERVEQREDRGRAGEKRGRRQRDLPQPLL